MNPRRAVVGITYNKKDVEESLCKHVTGFTYTDPSNGSSDTISIEIQNREKNFLNSWFPEKGDTIDAFIKTFNWTTYNEDWYKENEMNKFNCGTFTVDEFSFSGRPLIVSLSGISTPISESFNVTEKTVTWKSVTLNEIASRICKDSNLTLVYDADKIFIKTIEQSKKTSCSFLEDLCKEYGLYMKVYSNKLIIFNPYIYDKKDSVAVINEKDMLSWSYKTLTDGTYTGAKMSYSNGSKDISVKIGSGNRILNVSGSASSLEEAKNKCIAAVNTANRSATTMEIEIIANTKICASTCVEITGLGKCNGKYFVDKVVHNVGSGYTMQLSLQKVQTQIK